MRGWKQVAPDYRVQQVNHLFHPQGLLGEYYKVHKFWGSKPKLVQIIFVLKAKFFNTPPCTDMQLLMLHINTIYIHHFHLLIL